MDEIKKFPIEQLRIDCFDIRALNASFVWLNDSEIQSLIDSLPTERETQLRWFSTLDNRNDVLVKSIWHDNIPIGVMGLKNITNVDAEYWGYLGDKNYWGRQIGPWMIAKAVELARAYKIQKLYLKVLSTNERAVRLYQKTGFTLMNGKYDQRFIFMEQIIALDNTGSS